MADQLTPDRSADQAGVHPRETSSDALPPPPVSAVPPPWSRASGMPHVHLRDLPDGAMPPVDPRSPEMPGSWEELGRCQFEGQIAHGGMGAVFKGRDPDLGRELAIKVLKEAHRGLPEMERRFLVEAQIGGQLQHPGIVPVHEVGYLPDGRPYFTMKLVRGRTLDALLADRGNPAYELPHVLGIFQQVCQTMAYAHARGVIHRDLKPQNVMVGAFGEVHVVDWGLAKVLAERGPGADGPTPAELPAIRPVTPGVASRAGAVLGTPAYMAPEQAQGEVERVDERSDVFGLGAILCVILTGQPPYVGRTDQEVKQKAADGDRAEAMTRLEASGADGGLLRLAKACLAAEPGDRPRGAGVVAEELTTYLASVQERLRAAELARVVAQARAVQERRARRLTVGLMASVLVTTLLGGGVWMRWRQGLATTRSEVNAAMRGAVRPWALAKEAPLETSRPLWDEAILAAKRADAWLQSGVSDPSTRRRVRAFLDRLEADLSAEERDRRMAERLAGIRTQRSNEYDPGDPDAEYAGAFKDHGIDVEAPGARTAIAAIRARSPKFAIKLAASLDDWAAVRRERLQDAAHWRPLVTLARAVDPNAWRDGIRAALIRQDRPELRKRIGATDVTALSAEGVQLLVLALSVAGEIDRASTLLRAAQRRHPDDVWINYFLAESLHVSKPPRLDEAIRFYQAARAGRPEVGENLALALRQRGDLDEAIDIARDLTRLRPTQARYRHNLGAFLMRRNHIRANPSDLTQSIVAFWEAIQLNPQYPQALANLGFVLAEKDDLEGAVAACRWAILLKPDFAEAYDNLANALYRKGDSQAAIDTFHKALLLKPDFAVAYIDLGNVLCRTGDLKGAIASCREAIRLEPNDPEAHSNLGVALSEAGRLEEAIAAFGEAIHLRLDLAEAHSGLGLALSRKGDPQGSLTAYRNAVRLRPDSAEFHFNLGFALDEAGNRQEAIASYREAIRLQPNYPAAQTNLGLDLSRMGNHPEAIAALRRVILLQPHSAAAQLNLGNALSRARDWEGAIAADRNAIRLQPGLAVAHAGLGDVLSTVGRFAESLDAFRRAHELGSQDPAWPYPSARWVREAERRVVLDGRLPAILRREAEPAGPDESLEFAGFCLSSKELPGAAARFYDAAFTARPELAEDLKAGHRYNAACAAALAGCGRGRDDPPPDGQARLLLRKQALAWLRADLAAQTRRIEDGSPQTLGEVLETLQFWLRDSDLAGLRDEAALADLPLEDRDDCRALWDEVARLLSDRARPSSRAR
jgi:tetratricopeptide (TPR) repeat protein